MFLFLSLLVNDCILIYLEIKILCIYNFLILYRHLFGLFSLDFVWSQLLFLSKKKKKTKTKLKVRDVVTCGRSHVSGADHVSGTFYFMCMLSSPRPFPVPFFMSDLCLSLYVRVNQCRWSPCLNKTFLKLKRVKSMLRAESEIFVWGQFVLLIY